jgi:hypothetical protein
LGGATRSEGDLLPAALEEEMRIAEQILERRATTPEGLRVKAKVVAPSFMRRARH